MYILLGLFIIYGLFELIKSCTCKEKLHKADIPSFPTYVPENIRFTNDRQDPTGYEIHKGFGGMRSNILREELRKEGFCEERINRFIRGEEFIMCYGEFYI